MTATEIFTSLDRTLAEAREEHRTEVQTLRDQLLAAQMERDLHRTTCAAALADRDKFMRVATKLITQFGTVEAVFAEAKALALTLEAEINPGLPPTNPAAAQAVLSALKPFQKETP